MSEIAFLRSTTSYLTGASLQPAPNLVGTAEPDAGAQLPSLVLSLESTLRAPNGIGERAALITGALPWLATIDLANPVLPEEPDFSLLDGTRTVLTLPHGGLVKQDGSPPPLAAGDITVTAAGAAQTVVAGVPAAGQVQVDAAIGQLRFGTPLPPAGTVTVRYFLGQWEQRTRRSSGVLRIDVCDATANGVSALSDAVLDALQRPGAERAIRRLLALSPTGLSSVSRPETNPVLRRQSLRFAFTFEEELNKPDSSGGVLRRINGKVRVDATQDRDVLVTGQPG
jgi:hypothetical protein